MNLRLVLPTLALALGCSAAALAQAPAGAPAGSNGVCKDGTYSMAPVKSGACGGHKGVQTWYGPAAAPKTTAAKTTAAAKPMTPAPAAAPAPAPKPMAPAPMAAPAPKPMAAPAAPMAPAAKPAAPAAAPAAGGGPGMVWVNTSTKVYHCPGDRYYGKTKAGSYMTESAAKSAGFKADANKPCK